MVEGQLDQTDGNGAASTAENELTGGNDVPKTSIVDNGTCVAEN